MAIRRRYRSRWRVVDNWIRVVASQVDDGGTGEDVATGSESHGAKLHAVSGHWRDSKASATRLLSGPFFATGSHPLKDHQALCIDCTRRSA